MLVFTDGGCINNGKENAIASYAVYINNKIIRGHVMPYEYIYESGVLSCKFISIKPSNNRGELLSLIRSFIEILNAEDSEFIVYSDSQICVKTINEWYPSRLKKGTIHEFKNLDLIKIMMNLFYEIKKSKKIEIIHIKGHQCVKNNISYIQKIIIEGNNIVDKHASEILQKNNLIDYEIIIL